MQNSSFYRLVQFICTVFFYATVRSATVYPVSHGAKPLRRNDAVSSSEHLFWSSCPREYSNSHSIVQSSFSDADFAETERPILPSGNGFVYSVIEAYSHHHHLILRPDDVWISILSQLGFYIKAQAEEMRSIFVSHNGTKELTVRRWGSTATVDFGEMAVAMTNEIAENIKDPSLRDFFLPNFTTTTQTDRVVSAIQLMGSMQKYFEYIFMITCGIPSVTLLGERSDWQALLDRIEMVKDWGHEPLMFYCRIKPVLEYLVRSFDDPTGDAVVEFWKNVIMINDHCGGPTLTGWLTAFMFWKNNGDMMRTYQESDEWELPSWFMDPMCQPWGSSGGVNMNDIPDGFSSVPVRVIDNGFEYKTTMVSGSIGIQATSKFSNIPPRNLAAKDMVTGGEAESHTPNIHATIKFMQVQSPMPVCKAKSPLSTELDTLQPIVGWWMYAMDERYKRLMAGEVTVAV